MPKSSEDIGGGIVQMIRDEPRFASLPPVAQRVAAWAFRCVEEPVPTRDDIMRLVLAFYVIAGRMPRQVERRRWNRSTETPVLVDVFDWTDDRRIFSVLVWPSLESSLQDADHAHHQRVEEVKKTIAKGAPEMAWFTRFETDYGLRWDPERQVWTGTDGYAFDDKHARDAA